MYPFYRKQTLAKHEHQKYVFHFVRHTEEIDAAIEMHEKYGNLAEAINKMREMEEKLK
jgi:hypothetical protein